MSREKLEVPLSESPRAILGEVIELHETGMASDRDSPERHLHLENYPTNPHPRKTSWPGIEEDRWTLDYDDVKGNILRTKNAIAADQIVLEDTASVMHPVRDRILRTCTHCSKEVEHTPGRLPPIFCQECQPAWKDLECDTFCALWPSAWKKGLVVHCLRILHTVCVLSPVELVEFTKLDPRFPAHFPDNQESWNQAAELVRKYLRPQETEKLDQLGALLQRDFIRINKITNANSFGTNVIGIFLKAGIISHSCNPNCKWEMNGSRLTVTSIRDIKPGEEITVQYIPLVQSWRVAIRRTVILQRRGFLCRCDRCLEEISAEE